MFWATLSLFILGAVCSPVDEKSLAPAAIQVAEHGVAPAKTIEGVEEGANRDEKLFSVFQIVKFNNDACTASNGDTGICYTAAECSAQSGGTAMGSCASGFGVCCVVSLTSPCDGTTSATRAVLQFDVANKPADCQSDDTNTSEDNERKRRRNRGRKRGRGYGRQNEDNHIEYDYLIIKNNPNIVQLRIDFDKVELQNPTNGECTNDTILVDEADAEFLKIRPENLCGTLTGSHLYADFRDEDDIDIRIQLSEEISQNWRIIVQQLEETDDLYAPRGCLQYFKTDTSQSGTIMSFNNNGGMGEFLNNPAYTICLEHNLDYCDIELTASDFDLGGSNGACADPFIVGTSCLCGSTFGSMNMLTWNYTGNYNIVVGNDMDNTAMNSGFNIDYMLLAC